MCLCGKYALIHASMVVVDEDRSYGDDEGESFLTQPLGSQVQFYSVDSPDFCKHCQVSMDGILTKQQHGIFASLTASLVHLTHL